jgi:hypothetical protein
MDDLKIILDRIRKPLTFATRDNFAHLKSLAALESFMHTQIVDLKRLDKDRLEIAEIENLFSGFDALPPDQKKEHIIRAMVVVDSLEHGKAGATQQDSTSNRKQEKQASSEPIAPSGRTPPSSTAKASAPSGLNCFRNLALQPSTTRSCIFPGATRTGEISKRSAGLPSGLLRRCPAKSSPPTWFRPGGSE